LVVRKILHGIDNDGIVFEPMRARVRLILVFHGLSVSCVVGVLTLGQPSKAEPVNLSDHGVSRDEPKNFCDVFSGLPLSP
jgi:hypothetical protein